MGLVIQNPSSLIRNPEMPEINSRNLDQQSANDRMKLGENFRAQAFQAATWA